VYHITPEAPCPMDAKKLLRHEGRPKTIGVALPGRRCGRCGEGQPIARSPSSARSDGSGGATR
jgi:hypothetical protein